MIRRCRHQRLMGHTEHLTVARQGAEQIGHRPADTTTHARVDLIKQQGAGAIHGCQTGLEREQKTRHLPTRCHLTQRSEGLAGIGGKQKRHSVSTGLAWL